VIIVEAWVETKKHFVLGRDKLDTLLYVRNRFG